MSSASIIITDAALTAIDGWTELASRENDGLAVFLVWSKATDRVKVLVVDAKLDDAFDLDVVGAEAFEAFNHPFAYAAGRSSCFGGALRESTDLQLQS
jgi:hypothetical protein